MSVSKAPAPARIYTGHVMHMRLAPKRHQFRTRVFSLIVDLDRLEDVARRSWLLRLDRFGLLSLNRKDHGPRDGSRLRPWVDAELAKAGLPRPVRVEMLSFPRMLGYGFNPLTVYYAYDAAGVLAGLVYEVKNTYGDQIAYALPAGPDVGGSYRQTHEKEMYVSPLIDMEQTYRFTVNAPDARLALRIREAGPEGETLIATLTGTGEAMTDARLAKAFVAHPLMTLWVIALIHWHAFRLLRKGISWHSYSAVESVRKRLA